MKNYVTRSASLEDLNILLMFEQGIIEAERPFDPTLQKSSIYYYDLSELIRAEDSEVVVITCKDEIVASGYATIKKAKHYLDHEFYTYLGFMYTHPAHRGKGLNKLIIKALRDWSGVKGITEVRLTVYDDNTGALRAYEKVGFKKHLIEMRLA